MQDTLPGHKRTLKMALYRIITENINQPDIIKLVAEYTSGFTLIETQGYWQGKPENSLIIEIVGIGCSTANKIARAIKKLNNQESVLIQLIEAKDYFI